MPDIVSTIVGGDFEREFDLSQIYEDINPEIKSYNPESYSALYVKYSDGNPSIMLFASGKFKISGASSERQFQTAFDRFTFSLRRLGVDFERPELIVQNIVAREQIGRELDLANVAVSLGRAETEYEPEQFPGLQYKPQDVPGHFSIFSSGQILYTGTSDFSKIDRNISIIKKRIKSLFKNE